MTLPIDNIETFDFGFTAVDELELEQVQEAFHEVSKAEESVATVEEKMGKLFDSITILLSNLKKSPEKEYIWWPNRLEKIEKFEEHIASLMN